MVMLMVMRHGDCSGISGVGFDIWVSWIENIVQSVYTFAIYSSRKIFYAHLYFNVVQFGKKKILFARHSAAICPSPTGKHIDNILV